MFCSCPLSSPLGPRRDFLGFTGRGVRQGELCASRDGGGLASELSDSSAPSGFSFVLRNNDGQAWHWDWELGIKRWVVFLLVLSLSASTPQDDIGLSR